LDEISYKREVLQLGTMELAANDRPADMSPTLRKNCMPHDVDQCVLPLPSPACLQPQCWQHTEKYWQVHDLRQQLALLPKDDYITRVFDIPIVEPLEHDVVEEALKIVNTFGCADGQNLACYYSASDNILRARKVYLFINHCMRQTHTTWTRLCHANPMYHHAYINLLSSLSARDRMLMELFQQQKILEQIQSA